MSIVTFFFASYVEAFRWQVDSVSQFPAKSVSVSGGYFVQVKLRKAAESRHYQQTESRLGDELSAMVESQGMNKEVAAGLWDWMKSQLGWRNNGHPSTHRLLQLKKSEETSHDQQIEQRLRDELSAILVSNGMEKEVAVGLWDWMKSQLGWRNNGHPSTHRLLQLKNSEETGHDQQIEQRFRDELSAILVGNGMEREVAAGFMDWIRRQLGWRNNGHPSTHRLLQLEASAATSHDQQIEQRFRDELSAILVSNGMEKEVAAGFWDWVKSNLGWRNSEPRR